MKTIQTIIVSGLVTLLAIGCRKQPLDNLTEEESRIYITDHDSTVNFNNYQTFSMSDSVALIENGESERQLNETDAAYIAAVRNQMQARGFVEVDKKSNPDLGITVNRIVSTSTGVISNGSYWNNYNSYWDPYYWGYPGYGYYPPHSYSVYQIRQGAVSVDMVDLMNALENDKLKVVWTGLIRGSGIYNDSVAGSQVKALFDLSGYLKTE